MTDNFMSIARFQNFFGDYTSYSTTTHYINSNVPICTVTFDISSGSNFVIFTLYSTSTSTFGVDTVTIGIRDTNGINQTYTLKTLCTLGRTESPYKLMFATIPTTTSTTYVISAYSSIVISLFATSITSNNKSIDICMLPY